MAALPTGTVTFLFTDIEDGGGGAAARLGAGPRAPWPRSGQGVPTKWVLEPGPGTRLWEQHPDTMQQSLAPHDALLAHGVEPYDGLIVERRGERKPSSSKAWGSR